MTQDNNQPAPVVQTPASQAAQAAANRAAELATAQVAAQNDAAHKARVNWKPDGFKNPPKGATGHHPPRTTKKGGK